MLHRTEGIVLKSLPLGEADLIVTFLTPDMGPISAFAKSPRKTKSRFGSSLEPFTRSKISLFGKEDAKLPRLTQADIVEPFQALRESLTVFSSASETAMFTLRLLPEGEANKKAFSLFTSTLSLLADTANKDALQFIVLLYRIRLLDIAGYSPSLKGCARCGKVGFGFYTPEGAIICEICARSGTAGPGKPYHIRLSPGSIRLYEALRTWPMSKALRIKPSVGLMGEITALLSAHIDYLHPPAS